MEATFIRTRRSPRLVALFETRLDPRLQLTEPIARPGQGARVGDRPPARRGDSLDQDRILRTT
jgi:hypothetical protein